MFCRNRTKFRGERVNLDIFIFDISNFKCRWKIICCDFLFLSNGLIKYCGNINAQTRLFKICMGTKKSRIIMAVLNSKFTTEVCRKNSRVSISCDISNFDKNLATFNKLTGNFKSAGQAIYLWQRLITVIFNRKKYLLQYLINFAFKHFKNSFKFHCSVIPPKSAFPYKNFK
jgi:hypothetical protein